VVIYGGFTDNIINLLMPPLDVSWGGICQFLSLFRYYKQKSNFLFVRNFWQYKYWEILLEKIA